jgi:serine protease Do
MKNTISMLTAGMFGGLISLGGVWLMNPAPKTYYIKNSPDAQTAAQKHLASDPNTMLSAPTSFTEAADIAMPAVVNITASREEELTPEMARYYELFGMPPNQASTGSGVIISQKGHIITNNHVVKGANKLEITLYDGRTFIAELIGTDPNTDLAVLKIDAGEGKLSILEFANSDEVRIGEWVIAVGSPFGLASTVTAGIISAKGRMLGKGGRGKSIESYIQTDAAVNPGNSGGALVNTKGQLVGINTAIASPTGSYTGYSFAVPINLTKKIVQDIIEFGVVKRGFMGVGIDNVTGEIAQREKLTVSQGVFIQTIDPKGAAQEAGMLVGDVVVKINGKAIRSVPELQEQVGARNPGDIVNVTVSRKGEEKELVVKLKE